MTLRALVALLILILAPLPALAFGNCAEAGYRLSFDDRLPAAATCHVQELNPIVIEGRSTPVRILRFDRAFDADDARWLAALNDTIDITGLFATALDAGLRIQPVTIVLTSFEEHFDAAGRAVPPHTGSAVAHGVTNAGRLPTECLVTMYKLDDGVTDGEFTRTLAHELFHCIQFSTWTAKFLEPGGSWWIEGSAEYFGVLVAPEPAEGHHQGFGEASQTAGLAEAGVASPLDYENVAFFSWLHQQGGGPAVGAFLSDLPTGGAPANAQALIDLPQWTRFTEDLLADRVRLPGGDAVPKGRSMLVLGVDEADRDSDLETDAFRTLRADVDVTSQGRYEVSIDGPETLKARLRTGEGEWQDLPAPLESCRNSAPATFYAVTTEGPISFTVKTRKTGDCSPCETAGVGDSCMAGTWMMTGGGPLEWMRANGMPADVQVEASEMSVRMTRSGDYLLNPVRVDIEATSDGMAVTGDGQSVGLSGHWGAADGVLHICPISGEIVTNVQVDGGAMMSRMFGAGEPMQLAYSCNGNTMTTTMEIPGLGPMNTTYTRTGP